MLWFIILAGMAAILVAAWFKPTLFRNFIETYVKDAWVGFVGIALAMVEYFRVDPTWQQLVPPEYVPWFLVGVAVLSIFIRQINRDR